MSVRPVGLPWVSSSPGAAARGWGAHDAAGPGAAGGAAGAGAFALVVSWQGEGDQPRKGSHARPALLGRSKTPQLLVGACQLYHRSTG